MCSLLCSSLVNARVCIYSYVCVSLCVCMCLVILLFISTLYIHINHVYTRNDESYCQYCRVKRYHRFYLFLCVYVKNLVSITLFVCYCLVVSGPLPLPKECPCYLAYESWHAPALGSDMVCTVHPPPLPACLLTCLGSYPSSKALMLLPAPSDVHICLSLL